MNECKAALADTPTLRKIVPALLPLLWLLLLWPRSVFAGAAGVNVTPGGSAPGSCNTILPGADGWTAYLWANPRGAFLLYASDVGDAYDPYEYSIWTVQPNTTAGRCVNPTRISTYGNKPVGSGASNDFITPYPAPRHPVSQQAYDPTRDHLYIHGGSDEGSGGIGPNGVEFSSDGANPSHLTAVHGTFSPQWGNTYGGVTHPEALVDYSAAGKTVIAHIICGSAKSCTVDAVVPPASCSPTPCYDGTNYPSAYKGHSLQLNGAGWTFPLGDDWYMDSAANGSVWHYLQPATIGIFDQGNGKTCTPLTCYFSYSSTGPGPLQTALIVYDPDDDVYIIFDGDSGTWRYIPSTNTVRVDTLISYPDCDRNCSGVYDPRNHEVVIFGGHSRASNAPSNRISIYVPAAKTWTDRTVSSPPPAMEFAPVTYDSKRFKLAVYINNGKVNDFYEYDAAANNWIDLATTGGPAQCDYPIACSSVSIGYYPAGDRMEAYAGNGATGVGTQFWEWSLGPALH